VSTDEKHGILTKIEKGIERAADEYASNPAISLAFLPFPGLVQLLITCYILQPVKYKSGVILNYGQD
jgi:hypothetical protein